jgi:radical SAM superfamily enzyme YgiQ (UPF0313 family)
VVLEKKRCLSGKTPSVDSSLRQYVRTVQKSSRKTGPIKQSGTGKDCYLKETHPLAGTWQGYRMQNIKLHFILDMDENQAQFSPHFGIAYLSSFIKKHLPAVRISISYLSDRELETDIKRLSPDVIGITSTSRRFTKMSRIADKLQKKFALPVIWGGVHISIAPHELPADAVLGVIGEGEHTLKELLENFYDGRFHRLDQIKGIVYYRAGQLVVNQRRPHLKSLDDLPYPDLELLRYRYLNGRGVLISSRGCPYKCRFCASSIFWDRTRLHSAEYVVAYVKKLVRQHAVREILIYDDFFTINKQRVARIAELIGSDRELQHIKFECLSRVDCFDAELSINLKKMGIYKVSFGFESGCQETLNYLKNSKVNIEQSRRAVDIAQRAGLQCVGSFVIGSPHETVEQVEQTLDFIQELDLDAVQVTVATPFPGTAIWEDGKKAGVIEDDRWRDDYYAMFAFDELALEKTSVRQFLAPKRLLTRIEKNQFIRLVERAGRIQARINRQGDLRRELRKDYFPTCFELIRDLRQTGGHSKAVAVASLMAALDPRDQQIQIELGEIHFKSGHLQQAAKIFSAAVKKWPDNAIAHNNLGVLFQAAHNPSAALYHFREALMLDPEDQMIAKNLSKQLASLGRVQQAQQLLAAFHQTLPQTAGAGQVAQPASKRQVPLRAARARSS